MASSCIRVNKVEVRNEDGPLFKPFEFEITFECLQPLEEDLQWKVTYVGSPESLEWDQQLEDVLLGPLQIGAMKFVLKVPCPDYSLVPKEELLGVTCLLLTCLYRNVEFIRIGYYLNVSYSDPELQASIPEQPVFEKMVRRVASDTPRVTKFTINWDTKNPELDVPAMEGMMDGEEWSSGSEEEDASRSSNSEFEESGDETEGVETADELERDAMETAVTQAADGPPEEVELGDVDSDDEDYHEDDAMDDGAQAVELEDEVAADEDLVQEDLSPLTKGVNIADSCRPHRKPAGVSSIDGASTMNAEGLLHRREIAV
eukprot:Filipodium_phascolosomae@DN1704_c0_g1_i2.p1